MDQQCWKQGFRPSIVAVGIGFLFALVLGELILRLFSASLPGEVTVTRAAMYEEDPVIGWGLIPGYRGVESCAEFTMHVSVNSRGCRDKEADLSLNAKSFRILGIGDSFTMGYGVQQEETYLAQLEKLLNQAAIAKKRFRVYNAGIPGYSFREYSMFLAKELDHYAPHLITIGVTINDHTDACLPYPKYKPVLGYLQRHPGNRHSSNPKKDRHSGNSKEEKETSLWIRGKVWIYRNSILARAANRLLTSAALTDLSQNTLSDQQVGQVSWEGALSYLENIRDLAAHRRIPVVVLRIPHRSMVHCGLKKDAHIRQGLFLDLGDWLEAWSHENGLHYVDTLPALRKAAERGEWLYYRHCDAHWNAKGHRVAAGLLFERVGTIFQNNLQFVSKQQGRRHQRPPHTTGK